jgi:hypothetical protein
MSNELSHDNKEQCTLFNLKLSQFTSLRLKNRPDQPRVSIHNYGVDV